jgi:hypothetical protein
VVTAENLSAKVVLKAIQAHGVQLSGRASGAIMPRAGIAVLQASPPTPVTVLEEAASGDILTIDSAPGLDMRLKGCGIAGANIAPGTTINALASGKLTLSRGVAASIHARAALTIQCSYILYLQDVAGVSQGMSVRGAGVADGTQVDWVNPATLQIGLSRPTAAIVPGGTPLTFVQSWFSKIVTGAQVTSPALAEPAVVTAMDEAGGTITLSAPLRSPALSSTSNYVRTPRHEGTKFTFYNVFTDAQAAALQMDGLGLLAAEKAAEAAGGGTVRVPAGTFFVDLTMIFPTSANPSAHGVSLIGEGLAATTLVPVVDFGPSRYVLSCGDPTANRANALGIYANGGQFCPGEWRDFAIRFQGAGTLVGGRPQRQGVPIIMGGVKQGARHNMRSVAVEGFNIGIQFQGDWTTWNYVSSSNNFVGWRLDDPITNLFGDLRFDQVFFGGNGFAGLAIAPQAGLLATKIDKSWIADQPYNIWFEPGLPTAPPAIEQTIMDDLNLEGAGCGTIKDGNLTDAAPTGPSDRGLTTVAINASFFAADPKNFALPSGCQWRAYIDVLYANDLTISNIPNNAFAPQPGGSAAIRLGGPQHGAVNSGGVHLSGNIVPIIDSFGKPGFCQEIVGSRDGPGNTMEPQGALASVELAIPGVGRMRQYRLVDHYARSLPRGTLLEGVAVDGNFAAQPAGRAAPGTALMLGTTIADYAGCDMDGKWVAVIQDGLRVPMRVTAPQAIGTLLKLSAKDYGTATPSGDGPVIGAVTDTNGRSKDLVWVLGITTPKN